MARHFEDREDLFAEVTRLAARIELVRTYSSSLCAVAGWRQDGSFSMFGGHAKPHFGGDPAYHFAPEGGLRRAYVGGRLYRTQGTTLAELIRVRGDGTSELQRHDLTPDQLERFWVGVRVEVASILDAMRHRAVEINRQVPDAVDLWPSLRSELDRIHALSGPARWAPAIAGRR